MPPGIHQFSPTSVCSMPLSIDISYANLTIQFEALNLSPVPFQKVVRRRKDPGTRLKGAGAKAEVAAVLGTRWPVADGTATRAGMPAMVGAVGGKLVPESAVPDFGVYIRVSAMHVSAL